MLSNKRIGKEPFRLGKNRAFAVLGHNYRGNKNPLTTKGWLKEPERAWVYVGVAQGGKIKIGMSSVPEKRCKDLRVKLFDTVEVTPKAAKQVETQALRNMGASVGDTEWVYATPEEGIAAVRAALDTVNRYTHADPSMTSEEARGYRISLLGG